MKEEFIPYEEALALKELGFNEECFGYYDVTGEMSTKEILFQGEVVSITAPLYQQAFRWFREKYGYVGLVQLVEPEYGGDYGYVIYYKPNHLAVDHWNKGFNTHEEAQLVCLKKLIEIVKENL